MKELLKAYLDGELPADKVRHVEEALKRDAALRNEFDQMRRISSTLREASVTPAAAGLDKTLSALKSKQAIPKRSPLLRIAPAVGLAFAACVAVVVFNRTNMSSSDATVAMSSAPTFDNDPKPKHMGPHMGHWHGGGGGGGANARSVAGKVMDGTLSRPQPQDVTTAQDFERAPVNGSIAGENHRLSEADDPSGTVFMTESQKGYAGAGTLNKATKQIVKTAELSLLVADGKASADDASKLAKSLGGYVESSNLTGDDDQGMTGTLSIRIPVAKFDTAMAQLEKMGKVESVSSNAEDVTGAVTDDAARLTAMKTQEQSYLGILKQAKHIDDVLAVKDRLDSVQQDIESKTAELKTLRNEAAMSTITLTIDQKAKPKKPVAAGTRKNDWMNTTWAAAFGLLAAAGKTLMQALIYFVVFCPVWIPIIVLANLVSRRIRQTA